MRFVPFALVLLSAPLAAGCGGCGGQPNGGAAAGAPAGAPGSGPAGPAGPMFATLEFANWKKFPVGTVIKRKSVAAAEGSTATVTSVITFTLLKAGDEEVQISSQNTTERSDGSLKTVNPSVTIPYKRQFALPAGMTPEDFSKPARKAKKEGEEELTVLGKSYKAAVYTWTDQTEAGPLQVKVWLSEELPGRIAKQVMTNAALKTTTTEEVIEIKAP
jgi:hypothetical protein